MAGYATSLGLLAFISLSGALQNGDVRLINGPAKNKGRVEVYYNGEWGTVCDDSWNNQDGDVICKQLGYEYAERLYYRAYYGQGSGPIWVDQIGCDVGAQSILECRHNGWNITDCHHGEDAALDCKRKVPIKPRELPLRLSCPELSTCGSCHVCPAKKFPDREDCTVKSAVEGIVEVYYNNEWHPVSNDGWDMNSANVVCGELGYPLAMSIPTMDDLWCNWNGVDCSIGSGMGLNADDCSTVNVDFRTRMKTAFIKELECTGMENRLLDCYFKEFGPTTSYSMEVATVRCGYNPHPECNKDAEVYRTRGSAISTQGRLEVRIGGEWGTITDTRWDIADASVACRALGYGSAVKPTHRSSFGRGVGKVHFSHLNCIGSEKLLSDCPGGQVYNPNHGADAGVVCRAPQIGEMCGKTQGSKIAPARDTIGYIATNFVEVHGSKGWGLMCFDSIKPKVASVICRESSEMFVLRMRKASHSDRSKTKYWCALNCSGNEDSFNECLGLCLPVKECINQEAVLDCSPGVPDLVPHMEVFRHSLNYYLHEIPIYYLTCAREENCLSSSARGKPNHHTRMLLRFSSQTMNYGTASFEPILNRGEWLWHSCHNHFHSFEAFIHYDLIDPNTGDKVAEGHKASFCLEDSTCEGGSYPRYRCGTGTQGISMNCGDRYGSHLDCQWIDVTGVPLGRYILRQTVNPDRLALESDYENNIAECTVDMVPWYSSTLIQVVKDSCRLSDH